MEENLPMPRITLILILLAFPVSRAMAEEAMASWSVLLDRAHADAATASACAVLTEKARELAALPIIQRADSLAEVGTNRTWLDGRSNALEDEIRENFALAMSDFAACNTLSGELPVLAAAYRLTGDALFRDRVVAQLDEMASWSPLQRPGWTLYTPGNRLPADGKDGNWLATGCGVRAIGDALELLPAGTLDPALEGRLRALLETEVASIVDDWQTKRPWFVRTDNPITNQWVLPTEGLVRACLILGVDDRREAYELGVANLLKALDAHGAHGEFEEGVGYASFTVTSLLHAAHAMAVAGDRRAIDHPFLTNFPTWLVHHVQPGDMLINCFDAGPAWGAAARIQPLVSLLAVCTGSPVARWALAELTNGPSDDLAGLGARGLPPAGPDAAPPLFAYYERAMRVNWRDSWTPDGSGVWVRGGHPTDQHDHQDRGHVNFIAHGKPILIEAGTPSYDHRLMMTHYVTGAGHNVLQLGTARPERIGDAGKYFHLEGWQNRGGVAPIEVKRLDAAGGEVTLDGTACYDGLAHWKRGVTWQSDRIEVNDDVALVEGKQDVLLFRWHLGTNAEAVIESDGNRSTITWPDAEMIVEADAPITVSQTKLPDNTLAGHTGNEDPGNEHTCIVVQSQEPSPALKLTTRVTAK
ncbi:MAG: hypothetical protein QG656_508 [Candidatus Hydrogenedentes bacterium]|nr:hypothetical protein [Candidatus Hydrogenedentota bacterium]